MSLDSMLRMYTLNKTGSIRDWLNFSISPQEEETIERMAIKDIDSLCYSFICRYSKLSENFIERLLALTTGVLNEKSTDEEISKLTDLMVKVKTSEDKSYNPEITLTSKVTLLKDKTKKKSPDNMEVKYESRSYKVRNLPDRLDWVYISRFQQLSNNFLKKYAKYLSYRDLLAYESLDHDFIVEYGEHFNGYSSKEIKN